MYLSAVLKEWWCSCC